MGETATRGRWTWRLGVVAAGAAVLFGAGAIPAQATGDEDPAHYCGSRGFFTPWYDNGPVTDVVHHNLEPAGLVTHRFSCDTLEILDPVVEAATNPGDYVSDALEIIVTDEQSYLNQILHLCFLPACHIPPSP